MRALRVLLLLSAVAGCAPPPDLLFVDPRAQPVRVELRRSFGVVQKHYGPVLITECAFFTQADRDDPASRYPNEIWRVVNTAPEGGTLALFYGIVPAGFFQSNPPGGRPPLLEAGRSYTVECSGDAIGMGQFTVPSPVTRPAPPLRKSTP